MQVEDVLKNILVMSIASNKNSGTCKIVLIDVKQKELL